MAHKAERGCCSTVGSETARASSPPPPLTEVAVPPGKRNACRAAAMAARRAALAAQRCGARVEFFAMLRSVLERCEGSGLRPWAIDL